MTGEDFALAGFVFVCAAAYDMIFAAYVRAAAQSRCVAAANYSVFTYLVGAVGILSLVKSSVWYAIPEGAGLYCGTLIGVYVGTRPKIPKAILMDAKSMPKFRRGTTPGPTP